MAKRDNTKRKASKKKKVENKESRPHFVLEVQDVTQGLTTKIIPGGKPNG